MSAKSIPELNRAIERAARGGTRWHAFPAQTTLLHVRVAHLRQLLSISRVYAISSRNACHPVPSRANSITIDIRQSNRFRRKPGTFHRFRVVECA